MKKFLCGLITLTTLLFMVSCSVNNNNRTNSGAIDQVSEDYQACRVLKSFYDYNEYLNYIKSNDLPKDFYTADDLSNIGHFKIFLDDKNKKYMYSLDDGGYEFDLTVEYFKSDSKVDMQKFNEEEREKYANQYKIKRVELLNIKYDTNTFPNGNLTKCTNYKNGILYFNEMEYYYIQGELSYICFMKNNTLFTLDLYNYKGDPDTLISKLLSYSSAPEAIKDLIKSNVEVNFMSILVKKEFKFFIAFILIIVTAAILFNVFKPKDIIEIREITDFTNEQKEIIENEFNIDVNKIGVSKVRYFKQTYVKKREVLSIKISGISLPQFIKDQPQITTDPLDAGAKKFDWVNSQGDFVHASSENLINEVIIEKYSISTDAFNDILNDNNVKVYYPKVK